MKPYGPDEPFIKLEFLNHVMKRFLIGLLNIIKQKKLGGKGKDQPTHFKATKLQG